MLVNSQTLATNVQHFNRFNDLHFHASFQACEQRDKMSVDEMKSQ